MALPLLILSTLLHVGPGEPGLEPSGEGIFGLLAASLRPHTVNLTEDNYRQAFYFHNGDRQRRLLAFTIDDGPSGDLTREILEVLRRHRVSVTFFFLGERLELYGDAGRAVKASGHQIALHGCRHCNFRKLSRQEMSRELQQAFEIFERELEVRPSLFRPPYGLSNVELAQVAQEMRVEQLVFWDVDSQDWKQDLDASQVEERVLQLVKPGSVVLLHSTHQKTPGVIDHLIPTLRKQGYEVVSVGFLLNADRYEKVIPYLRLWAGICEMLAEG